MHRHVDAVVAVHRIKGIVADILRFKKPHERQEIIHTTTEFLGILLIEMRGQPEFAPEMKRIVRLFWYERLHTRSRRRTLRRNARQELLECELVTRIARSILDHSIVPKARVRGRAAAIGGTVWTDTTPGYFWLYAQLPMTSSAAVTP
jgi:hypothetical protein